MGQTATQSETRTRTMSVADGILLASWTAMYALLLFGFQSLKWLERVFSGRQGSQPAAEGGKRFAGGER